MKKELTWKTGDGVVFVVEQQIDELAEGRESITPADVAVLDIAWGDRIWLLTRLMTEGQRQRYARRVALDVADLWACPDVVRRWLATGDDSMRSEAAEEARSAAEAAAWSALSAAAWSAAWSAAAAWSDAEAEAGAAWSEADAAERSAAEAAAWSAAEEAAAAWSEASAARSDAEAAYIGWAVEMLDCEEV